MKMLIFPDVFHEALIESEKAEDRYGSFASTHEGFGVLAEEVSELLDAIRSNLAGSVRIEAIQVAAVALRIAESMSNTETKARSGMGG
jgi:NTP pyrophosphatase (non-canonical NTP hydrolase)